jgi:regulator of protease activity HflC (stomatin/prohibitin superfamily)
MRPRQRVTARQPNIAAKAITIIHAEGEYSAAEKLGMAAEIIQRQPAAMQLRYLQTLVEIGAEKNTTVIFPVPIDILKGFIGKLES